MYIYMQTNMLPEIAKIKGVHPGLVLKRELKRNQLKSSELAMAIGEHKQTLSAIINQRRGINPDLSVKLGSFFNIEEDYFMMLQAAYEVKNSLAANEQRTPDLSKIRKVLFWDTSLDKIDWIKNKRVIIQRILERGNDTEIREMIRFYGESAVSKIARSIKDSRLPSFQKNAEAYNLI